MIPFALLIISVVTHFLFFGHPAEVVFDEVHIGNFISNYWQGTYFFDVHPPLAKLLIAGFGYLIGAHQDIVNWATIGNPLTSATVALRFLPLVAGTLLPLIIYWICRRLHISKTAAFAAGLIVCLENSLLVESRFMIVDAFILFFGFLSVACYLEYRRRANYDRIRWLFVSISAISAAAAVSVKWTGLSFIILIVLFEAYLSYKERGKILSGSIKRAIVLGGAFILVCVPIYIGLFAIHISLLPNSGPGDAFMTPGFQKTLIGNRYDQDTSITPLGFSEKFIELNGRMFDRSASLTAPHQYSSEWYTWPLMLRPIFYWQSTSSQQSFIYLIGNPVIYWLGAAAIIALIVRSVFFFLRTRKAPIPSGDGGGEPTNFFILVGYAVNFLPFIFIGRVMFLYHYQAALVMSIIAIAYIIDMVPNKRKKMLATVCVGLSIVAFVFFSPLTYGTPLNDNNHSIRVWLSSWR